jgi:hypothetical protein
MERARVRFTGADAAAAVRAAGRGLGECAVTLRVHIRHVYRRGPPPVYRTITAEEVARLDCADALAVAALVDTVHSKHFTYHGVVLGGSVTVFDDAPPAAALDLRMRRATLGTSLEVDARGTWDAGTGRCVYDFLLHRYAGIRAVRAGGEEYLRATFDAVGGVATREHGVSTAELDALAERHRLRMYAATPDGRVFHRREGSSRHPPLAYVVANGHMFPVTSAAGVFHMARHGTCREPRAEPAPTVVLPVGAAHAPRAERADVVVEADDLDAVWARAIRAHGLALNAGARAHGTRVVKFRTPSGAVACNRAWREAARVAAALGVCARPMDGVGAVARRFFHARLPALAHLCVVTQPVALRTGVPRTAFVGRLPGCLLGADGAEGFLVNEGLSDDSGAEGADDGLRCFDVRRCYATELEGNGGFRWAVAGPFDEVEPYDGQPLGPGRYYVTRGRTTLPRGAGWYYERWARRAVDAGATVLAQQRARRSLDADYFAPAVAACRAALDADAAKLAVNSFIGGLRVASRAGGRCVATTSRDEARCVAGPDGVVRVLAEQTGEHGALYAALPRRGARPPRPEKADLGFLYDQVVEGGWCALDELCARLVALGARIVAVSTDSAFVRGAVDASRLGDKYREETGARAPAHALAVVDAAQPPLAPLEWREPSFSTGLTGCLFVGMAGTGKTHEARAFLARLAREGKRVVAVGPTVKAAANVGGRTVHALYEMRDPERFCDPPDARTLRAVARRYDAILVDEVFMCTGWMLETFLSLRRAGLVFVLAGDPEQLPPVFTAAPEPALVARSALVHEVVDGCVRVLVAPRRSLGALVAPGTPDVFSACRALLSGRASRAANRAFAALFRTHAGPLPERNLAYLNATCARVNRELVLRRARGRVWLVGGTVCAGAWALRRALGAAPAVPSAPAPVAPSTPVDTAAPLTAPSAPAPSAAAPASSSVFATGAPVIARSAAFTARGARTTIGAIGEVAEIGGARVALDDVARAFELAYCVTIHRAQCETIDEPYVVHDLERILAMPARAARALLYVAVSRARSAALVSFAGAGLT